MNRGDYTYEKVLEGFGKEKAPFIIWREEDLFVLRPYPVKTKFWGFFFCALNPQLHSRSATYIKRNGLLIRKITIKSSRPFQCAYHPLTP